MRIQVIRWVIEGTPGFGWIHLAGKNSLLPTRARHQLLVKALLGKHFRARAHNAVRD
jgi:hypothetical protein